MIFIVVAIIIAILLFVPQLWLRHTISRYNEPIAELPGTGAELAEHFIKRFELDGVTVIETEPDQDCYDHSNKQICLSPDNYHNKSLSAVAIAAHEFGHALQHHQKYSWYVWRIRLTKIHFIIEKIASALLVTSPLIMLLTKVPLLGLFFFASGILVMTFSIVLHLCTLPVEWDASFHRALPLLQQGKYLPESAIPATRKILFAAAITYLAGALSNLLNCYRWFALLRR